MKHPKNDLTDRAPIWDAMQMFWMDTDPEVFFKHTAQICCKSKYSIAELRLIYWNEVMPAVSFNIKASPAPEWTGFNLNFLVERILRTHKYGKRLPIRCLHRYANKGWKKLKAEIVFHHNQHNNY